MSSVNLLQICVRHVCDSDFLGVLRDPVVSELAGFALEVVDHDYDAPEEVSEEQHDKAELYQLVDAPLHGGQVEEVEKVVRDLEDQVQLQDQNRVQVVDLEVRGHQEQQPDGHIKRERALQVMLRDLHFVLHDLQPALGK